MRELILKLNRERQITVLISSHILDELSRLATHYGFLDHGAMVRELSAQELEEACRKCIRVEVSVAALSGAGREGISYAILSDTAADSTRVNVSHLALALSQRGCEIRTMEERDESLESFYVNLVGGDRT